LESVKILPPKTDQNSPELWGDIISQAISLAEINSPFRKRIFCMAITAPDINHDGKPSSWSAAIDQLISGESDKSISGENDHTKQLFLVAGGNIRSFEINEEYPKYQLKDSIHDPAQSWNCLSIGAYTQLTTIIDTTYDGHSPLAGVNELSPFSTTSCEWDDQWPIKPDVLFEGGNSIALFDGRHLETGCPDLSMISTNHIPSKQLFNIFNMTSAATAQAANFAAQIQQIYPMYWPETIRGLIVHSAEWPKELKQQFIKSDTKTERKKLLRIAGYGVPNLEKAIYCASNSLTLISEASIQPYERYNYQITILLPL
jgi:hypothetical protein